MGHLLKQLMLSLFLHGRSHIRANIMSHKMNDTMNPHTSLYVLAHTLSHIFAGKHGRITDGKYSTAPQETSCRNALMMCSRVKNLAESSFESQIELGIKS